MSDDTTTAAGPIGSGGVNVPYASGIRPGYAAESANVSLFQRDGFGRARLHQPVVAVEADVGPAVLCRNVLFAPAPKGAPVGLRGREASQQPPRCRRQHGLYGHQHRPVRRVILLFADLRTGSPQQGRYDAVRHQAANGQSPTISRSRPRSTPPSATKSTNYIPDTAYNYGTDAFTFVNNDGSGGGRVNTVGDPEQNPANLILDQLFDQRTVSRGGDWSWRADGEYDFASNDYIKSIQGVLRLTDRSAHNSAPSNSGINCTQPSNATLAYNAYILDALASPDCKAYLAQGSCGNSPANFTHLGGITVASLGAGAAQRTEGTFFGGKYGETGWVFQSRLAGQQYRDHPR